MTELLISPLARRIAEENNVNWRILAGSDAGGGINERDVLNYLEGVMLGTKPVDPTPEPLPEGMTSWAEADGEAQSPWTAKAIFVATDPVAPPSGSETSPETVYGEAVKGRSDDVEDVYRELFAELGALKTAAAETAQAHEKEREAAEQVRLDLEQTQKTLANREGELTELRAQLSKLEAASETDRKTRDEGVREAQLELTRLRETLTARDEERLEMGALKQQLETLETQLSAAEAQAQEVRTLAERLVKADGETRKAQAEAEQLSAANRGLEQTVKELGAAERQRAEQTAAPKRPWWKLWG